jgi:Zn-finger nucleic acid-binding protein
MSMNTLRCPCCAVDLRPGDVPDVAIHGCARCGGHWLDNRACQLVISGELGDEATQLLRSGQASAAPGGYREPAAPTERACPVCEAALDNYQTSQEQHGVRVVLDVCGAHGTWFDRGEAWTLLQAASLERLALDVEIQQDAADAAYAVRESRWNRFLFRSRS